MKTRKIVHHRTTQNTRKKRKDIYLTYMSKKSGGRHHISAKLHTLCSPETAHARLVAVKSLKLPDEGTDLFVHVAKAISEDHPLVIKIQDIGASAIKTDLAIQEKLKHCNNIVKYICNFTCRFDHLLWRNVIKAPRDVCTASGELMHVTVMEYIKDDLSSHMNTTKEILYSVVKQAGFALMDFYINYGVCHNDINRGNVLLDIDAPKTLTYTILNKTYVVNTLGYEVVYIDFGLGYIYDNEANSNTNNNWMYDMNNINNDTTRNRHIRHAKHIFNRGQDQVSQIYCLMAKWSNTPEYTVALQRLYENVMSATTYEEILELIANFSIE